MTTKNLVPKTEEITAGSLWNQSTYDSVLHTLLWGRLVPPKGEADTPHGEALRGSARVLYDVYNNGGCNLGLGHFDEMIDDAITWTKAQVGVCSEEDINRFSHAAHRVEVLIERFKEYEQGDYSMDPPDPLGDSNLMLQLELFAITVIRCVAMEELGR